MITGVFPMTIEQLAMASVSLIVKCLTKMGDGTLQKAGEDIWDKVKNKFSKNNDLLAQATLTDFQKNPSDKDNQNILKIILTKTANADPLFAEELKLLLQNNSKDEKVASFLTNNFGEIGNLTNISNADTINIGTPNNQK
jgi:S-formylglutathione hydrolase FrmB